MFRAHGLMVPAWEEFERLDLESMVFYRMA